MMDLETLSNDFVWIVREILAPAHLSLWLHPAAASRGKGFGETS
jgi:hypothetical protein